MGIKIRENMYTYIYIYIYVCVCVCLFGQKYKKVTWENSTKKSGATLDDPFGVFILLYLREGGEEVKIVMIAADGRKKKGLMLGGESHCELFKRG